jgi:vitamin B12 transporter
VDNPPDGPSDSTDIHSHDRVRRRSVDLRANWRLRPAGTVTVGGAVEDAHLHSTFDCRTSFGDCSSAPLVKTRSTHAYFVQALIGVGRPVSLNVGGRLEDNQQFGTFATWRAGAAWRLDAATRLRASAGTGFKEPTFFESYSSSPYALGNPDLRPERSFSWEGGIEHALSGTGISIAVTYFDQYFRDLIVYVSGTPSYLNVAEARASGAEVQVDYVVQRSVVASVSYTYLDTRVLNGGGDPTFTVGERLLRRPTNAANVQLAYRPGRGSATLAVRFAGDRDDLDFAAPTFPSPRVTLHPYTRVNAAVAYPVRWGLALELRADNLLDDRGREIANFPVPGRSLFFGGRFTGGLAR